MLKLKKSELIHVKYKHYETKEVDLKSKCCCSLGKQFCNCWGNSESEDEKNFIVNINQDSKLNFIQNIADPETTKAADVWYKTRNEVEWTKLEQKVYDFKAGQTVYFKGNNPDGLSKLKERSTSEFARKINFQFGGNVSLKGNIMTLLNNGTDDTFKIIPNDYCFDSLFDSSTGITSVANIFLPATTLAEKCYSTMFYWCNNLTKAPELPATNLAPGCYDGMFNTCNKLISAPKLPASNLSESCYASMFCGCNGLTSSPELTATTLVNGCYERMFYHCSKLNTIKIHYEGNFEQQYFNNWVNGVASTGTFYYKGIDKENFGTSAIPLDTNNHWTIESNW